MGDLTRNFSRFEFACKCGCGFDTVDFELVNYLQQSSDFFEKRTTITSGCRCPAHNKNVGGEPLSWHLRARAADHVVHDIPPHIVYEFLDSIGVPGLIMYDNFVHADTRSGWYRDDRRTAAYSF
jgi:uncharacterized protein YcbK (DUF882 family)